MATKASVSSSQANGPANPSRRLVRASAAARGDTTSSAAQIRANTASVISAPIPSSQMGGMATSQRLAKSGTMAACECLRKGLKGRRRTVSVENRDRVSRPRGNGGRQTSATPNRRTALCRLPSRRGRLRTGRPGQYGHAGAVERPAGHHPLQIGDREIFHDPQVVSH